MDKFFKITERGSSVRAEIVGGVTTFFAMAYIIFVNPATLCVFTDLPGRPCPYFPNFWKEEIIASQGGKSMVY